jgi:decaprenylphospho-beta-D-ribofuranose 2-oxidase
MNTFKKKEFFNWSRNVLINSNEEQPNNLDELKKIIKKKNFITVGNHRSFGDGSLNNTKMISMRSFNKIISFDIENGIIEVESGLLLKDLLPIIMKKGWFIPVTPGTKYVTIGGMIANNVNGKNTQKTQIKYYIKSIKLLTSKNKVIKSSPKRNKKIFDLTIGGFGLTGAILSSTIKLRKISSPYMDQEIVEFKNYDEYFSISKKIKKYQYSVAWIDNFSNNNIIGLWFLSNHSKKQEEFNLKPFKEKKIGLFAFFGLYLIINNYFISRLAHIFFRNYNKFFYNKKVYYDKCFYPQDYAIDWNKAYGKKGLFQFQFLIPEKKLKNILSKLSNFLKTNSIFSSFVVIKKIKETGKYLNFAGTGYSVSLDFPINKKFIILSKFLDKIVRDHKLKVNFTKDSICTEESANIYKDFKLFKKRLLFINPKRKINSKFSKRLNI